MAGGRQLAALHAHTRSSSLPIERPACWLPRCLARRPSRLWHDALRMDWDPTSDDSYNYNIVR